MQKAEVNVAKESDFIGSLSFYYNSRSGNTIIIACPDQPKGVNYLLQSAAVAVLVFLARATGTGVIAAYTRAIVDNRRGRLLGTLTCGCGLSLRGIARLASASGTVVAIVIAHLRSGLLHLGHRTLRRRGRCGFLRLGLLILSLLSRTSL